RDGTMGRTVNNADARFSYTAEELRKMKLAHERSLSRQWGWRDQNDLPCQQNRITARSGLRGPLARHSRPFAPPVLARQTGPVVQMEVARQYRLATPPTLKCSPFWSAL